LHTVVFDGKPAGIIIYECKRTPRIQANHVNQAHRAKQTRGADYAVLVTTGQRKGFSGLSQMKGVLVVSPLAAVPIASLLRTYLIEMLKARITQEKRAVVAQRLLRHVTSPQFKNPIEEVVLLSSELQAMVKDEFKVHMRTWKKRWDYYQTIEWDGNIIRNNVTLVLQGKKPAEVLRAKLPPLHLPSGRQ